VASPVYRSPPEPNSFSFYAIYFNVYACVVRLDLVAPCRYAAATELDTFDGAVFFPARMGKSNLFLHKNRINH
jgi:hypothetical protein